MELNDLITRLNIMKKENPEEFKNFMNRLKVEKPGVYEKVIKVVILEEESPISFGEEPLELKISDNKENKYTINIILIVILVIIIFLGVIFFISQ